ncbi:MAG: hypothetical protein KZY74_05410 [Paenibacillaceae bacterium]|nr:hypothetical protein [Paenibacillaceae bacterium]
MDFAAITAIISVAAALSGIALGWSGRSRTIRQEVKAEGGNEGALRQDVEYIKRGVDDIRVDVRMQGQRIEAVSERVTRVEESTKQAHKRIDRLEE